MKKTVLVIDGGDRSAQELKHAFAHKPYELLVADSASDGLAILRSTEVDVLVCDDKPKGMSGIAVLKIAKVIAPDCLRVLVTTSEGAALAAYALSEINLFRFIFKPCAPGDIHNLILDALKARRDHHHFRVNEASRLHPEVDEVLNTEIDRALGSCRMVYQPVLSVRSQGHAYGNEEVRSTYGYEALLRVDHPSLSTPLLLIDAVRTAGREFDLDRVVRRLVANDLSTAASTLDPEATIFINQLTKSLEDPDLLDGREALHRFAHRVVLEVSEAVPLTVLRDLEGTKRNLRQLGFRLGLDDLGGGPTGFRVFGRIAPDVVKFDMSEVRGVHQSSSRAQCIVAMIKVCKEMGCISMAERIETKQEFDYLVELGCELFQGYYVGRPSAGFTPIAESVDSQMSYGAAR